MAKVVSPHLKSLIFDALLASFWRKHALQRFVRGCGISSAFTATMGADETKRGFLERMFVEVERTPQATKFFLELAQALAEQSSFADLNGWEDSREKIASATEAVERLRAHLRSGGQDADTHARRARALQRGSSGYRLSGAEDLEEGR